MSAVIRLKTLAAASQSTGIRRRRAFTLVECVVVIAILALVIGLLVPAVQKVRASAAKAHCASNLRQLAVGVHNFDATLGKLPQGCEYPFDAQLPGPRTGAGISWHTAILPQIEQASLWSEIWMTHSLDPSGELNERHRVHGGVLLPVLLCPADGIDRVFDQHGRRIALTNYSGVAGTNLFINDGMFHAKYTVRFTDASDGTSNTIMIGERVPGRQGDRGAWYAGWTMRAACVVAQIMPAGYDSPLPEDASGCNGQRASFGPANRNAGCTLERYGSFHPSGANFAFADGSVRFLRYSAVDIIPELATKAGGETVSLGD